MAEKKSGKGKQDPDLEAAGVTSAIESRAPGPYQLQAAIAALHARAPRPEDTDWPQIAALYRTLALLCRLSGCFALPSSRAAYPMPQLPERAVRAPWPAPTPRKGSSDR